MLAPTFHDHNISHGAVRAEVIFHVLLRGVRGETANEDLAARKPSESLSIDASDSDRSKTYNSETYPGVSVVSCRKPPSL